MTPFANVVLFSSIAGAATLVGIAMVLAAGRWTEKYCGYIVSAAAGFLVAIAVAHVLPEALKLNDQSPLWFISGFVVFFAVEHFITVHACRHKDCDHEGRGLTAAAGIGIHSLFDGVAIGVGFEVDAALGILTAAAVILHELPEGVFTYTILINSGADKRRSIVYSVLVALATPVGAVLTFVLFRQWVNEAVLGVMLGFIGGTFIYIGAGDLTPEAHRGRSFVNVVMLALGAVGAVGLGFLAH
jgi:zinc and cadmium transporter